MPRPRRAAAPSILAALVLLAPAGAAAQVDPVPPAPPAVREALADLVRESGAPGVLLLVYRDGRLLYREQAGRIRADEPVPVASAGKWMAAAAVMTLVDEGLLDLEEPIGRRLPEYQGAAGAITLAQLLSYTAGQGGLMELAEFRLPPDLNLRQGAARLAERPLRDAPGGVFRYGGPSFQVAGALAELAAGQPWEVLFQERLAGPLGLSDTRWSAPGRGAGGSGAPNLQAGLVTTAEDYGRFLGLIAGRGVVDGRRILSPSAVGALTTARTLGLPMAYKPPGAGDADVAYALGAWCESHDAAGRCDLVSSPGMFGVYPWVDFETGLYGVFFAKHRLPPMIEGIRRARDAVEQSAAPA